MEERFDFICFMYGISCVSPVRSHTILNCLCVRVGFFWKRSILVFEFEAIGDCVIRLYGSLSVFGNVYVLDSEFVAWDYFEFCIYSNDISIKVRRFVGKV